MDRWDDSEQSQRDEHAGAKRSKSSLREFRPQRHQTARHAQNHDADHVENFRVVTAVEGVVQRGNK